MVRTCRVLGLWKSTVFCVSSCFDARRVDRTASKVSVSIYNSQAYDREGKGYQATGYCHRVTDFHRMKKALQIAACQRFLLEDEHTVQLTALKNWRDTGRCLYEIVLDELWMNTVQKGVDIREKVDLHTHKWNLAPFRPTGKL